MSRVNLELTAEQSKYYDLGRQARVAGYSSSACNMSTANKMRGWWMAGYWDTDSELKARETPKEAA
jgi:hypothetical protein